MLNINTKNGVLYIGKYGIIYKTNRELDEIKQAWRKCSFWHPTNSLIEVNCKYNLV